MLPCASTTESDVVLGGSCFAAAPASTFGVTTVRLDLGGAGSGVVDGQQFGERHLHEVRIADGGRVVREPALHRLGGQVHVARRQRRVLRQVERAEDLQDLDERDAADGRRRGDDVESAVPAPHRLALDRPVGGKVGFRDPATLRGHLRHDRCGECAAVEHVRAALGDGAKARPEVGVLQRVAGFEWQAPRAQQAGERRIGPDGVEVVEDDARERRADDKPLIGQANGRREYAGERHGAVLLQRCGQSGHRPRNGDRRMPGARHAVREIKRGGRRRPVVDGDGLPRTGEEGHHHALAADPARVRLDDANREGSGDGGVNRVAAGLEHLQAGLGSQRVRRRHHAPLCRHLRVARGGGGRREGRGKDRGGHQRRCERVSVHEHLEGVSSRAALLARDLHGR